jgi:hypothetical protein
MKSLFYTQISKRAYNDSPRKTRDANLEICQILKRMLILRNHAPALIHTHCLRSLICLRFFECHNRGIDDRTHFTGGNPSLLLLLVEAFEIGTHEEGDDNHETPESDVDDYTGMVVWGFRGLVNERSDDLYNRRKL